MLKKNKYTFNTGRKGRRSSSLEDEDGEEDQRRVVEDENEEAVKNEDSVSVSSITGNNSSHFKK